MPSKVIASRKFTFLRLKVISMHLLRKRYRWQLRVAVLLAGGIAIGLVAAAWVPVAWAGVLGGSITTMMSAIILGTQTEWRRRSEIIRHLPVSLEVSTKSGRFPLVRELSNPIAVGVHPAAAIEEAGMIDRVPPYVARDIEADLHAALQREGFVLLVGESTAGKTRAAFEATRLLLGSFRFVAPSSRAALPAVLEILKETDSYVVWLDDLERFLGVGGLTTAVLQRLLAPQVHTIIVATMRSHEYDRYRDRAETEFIGADRDVWRESRAVLRQAQILHLDRRWTAEELYRAQAHVSDRRLAHALAVADHFGVAETLAAGPELAETWRNGWTPGHHPRGAALVAAAVGARRFGYHRPLPMHVLECMHSAYLAERGGPELRPEPMAEAMQWATTPTFANGANSLLIGSPENGYLAFDYLIDLPLSDTMPDSSWSFLAGAVDAPDAYSLGGYAIRAGQYDHALIAYRRAAEASYQPAVAGLVNMGAPFTLPPESLERAREHLRQTRRALGPNHESSILAEQSVIIVTVHSGHYADALALAEKQLIRIEPLFGPQDRNVLAVKFTIGSCMFRLGLMDEGLMKLDKAVEETAQALGPHDVATLDRQIVIVRLLAEAGQIDVARKRLAALRVTCADFPAKHFITIRLNETIRVIDNQ